MRILTLSILTLLAAICSYAQAPVSRNLSCVVTVASAGTLYTCSIPGVSGFSYVNGTHYWFQADLTNAGSVHANFNGAGSLLVAKPQGGVSTPLVAGDIQAHQWVETIYDGTGLQMQSLLGNLFSASGYSNGSYCVVIASGVVSLLPWASCPGGGGGGGFTWSTLTSSLWSPLTSSEWAVLTH